MARRIFWGVLIAIIIGLGVLVWVVFRAGWASFGPSQNITDFIPRALQNGAVLPGEEVGMPLNLEAGFTLGLYAENVVGSRVLALDPQGVLFVSLTSEGQVVALLDQNKDGFAETQEAVLTNLRKPHGLVFYEENGTWYLFVAEEHQVSRYTYDQFSRIASSPQKLFDLPADGGHFTRTIGIGPDKKLYTSVGSSCNVCVESNPFRGAILQSDLDGSNLRVWASGLRNTVFFVFGAALSQSGSPIIFGTDNGRDWLGDDAPPDELNLILADQDYGWPYCYGNNMHDEDFDPRGIVSCATKTPALADLPAHSAALGIQQITSSAWPEDWQNNFLIAYHGSWNRSEPTGYKVVRLSHAEKGDLYEQSDFLSGWLQSSMLPLGPDSALGRPVDLLFNSSGQLYISDDKAGVIYIVTPK